MTERTVSVKWNKTVFDSVTLSADETIESLKEKLFALSKVPADRQKLLLKGRFLKDTASVSAVPAGAQLVLMGTAEAIADGPSKPILFEEDLSSAQKAEMNAAREPAGLVNLGNTCYLNSVVQALRSVPELTSATKTHLTVVAASGASPAAASAPARLSLAYAAQVLALDRAEAPQAPAVLVQALRKAHPQFAEVSRSSGVPAQQDADECLLQLLNAFADTLTGPAADAAVSATVGATPAANAVDALFGAPMESRMVCSEAPEEPAVVTTEVVRRLKCTINIDVNFMIEGLKLAMKEEIEKRSPSLNRTAKYTRTHALTGLPPYLTVQFERFFWKADAGVKSKIIRKVAFPVKFDVFELTGGALRAQLKARRAVMLKQQEVKLGLPPTTGSGSAAAAGKGKAMADKDTEPTAAASAGAAAAEGEAEGDAAAAAAEPHPLTSGSYELHAVVTHKGRDADSGHYIGWTKQPDGRWFKFDDDTVTEVKEAEIVALSGGGDWHMAYLVIYKRIDDVAEEAKTEQKDKAGSPTSA